MLSCIVGQDPNADTVFRYAEPEIVKEKEAEFRAVCHMNLLFEFSIAR